MGAWREHAACRDEDTALFFPAGATAGQIKRAKKLCQGCPVRDACLAYALAAPERYGIWGGLTEGERDRKRRRTGRKRRTRKEEAVAS